MNTKIIPDYLTDPVTVTCKDFGNVSRSLGQCAIDLREGLDTANSRLTAIKDIVDK